MSKSMCCKKASFIYRQDCATRKKNKHYIYQDDVEGSLVGVGGAETLVIYVVRKYRQISNINRTLLGIKIIDHSDVVRASPIDAAPTTLHSRPLTWLQWIGQKQV